MYAWLLVIGNPNRRHTRCTHWRHKPCTWVASDEREGRIKLHTTHSSKKFPLRIHSQPFFLLLYQLSKFIVIDPVFFNYLGRMHLVSKCFLLSLHILVHITVTRHWVAIIIPTFVSFVDWCVLIIFFIRVISAKKACCQCLKNWHWLVYNTLIILLMAFLIAVAYLLIARLNYSTTLWVCVHVVTTWLLLLEIVLMLRW